ncbi:MAG: DUF3096 domain-containing protein [Candidatus Gracilibacteria bacterium]|nr:DUF3096 domain-containing protein [Candidatus Gracilibacteria bacterium]
MINKYNEFVNNLFWSFVFDGIVALTAGALVIIYPDLLSIAVGTFLIILGLKGILFAFKVRKNSGVEQMEKFMK